MATELHITQLLKDNQDLVLKLQAYQTAHKIAAEALMNIANQAGNPYALPAVTAIERIKKLKLFR